MKIKREFLGGSEVINLATNAGWKKFTELLNHRKYDIEDVAETCEGGGIHLDDRNAAFTPEKVCRYSLVKAGPWRRTEDGVLIKGDFAALMKAADARYSRLDEDDKAWLIGHNITLPPGTDCFDDSNLIGDGSVITYHAAYGDHTSGYIGFSCDIPANSYVEILDDAQLRDDNGVHIEDLETVYIVYTPKGTLVKPGCMPLQSIDKCIDRLERFLAKLDKKELDHEQRLGKEFGCAAKTEFSKRRAQFWLAVLTEANWWEWSAK